MMDHSNCDIDTFQTEDSLSVFTWTESSEKTLPGTSGVCANGPSYPEEDDQIGDFAVLIDDYLGTCSQWYTDGSYNQKDFRVIKGKISGSNDKEFEGYELYSASTPATAYTAIKNKVAYKFQEKCDWQLYFFDGNTFSIQLDISADDIEVGEWTVLDEMDITTYFPKE